MLGELGATEAEIKATRERGVHLLRSLLNGINSLAVYLFLLWMH
jgi:hypothetical protein